MSAADLPSSLLFCCDHNSVRSPMAEGLAKKIFGTRAYLQSAGIRSDRGVDGFAIAVCAELGVELARHRSRSFEEMQRWGDDLGAFDLVVALSPASWHQALELTRSYSLDVVFWPIADPTATGGSRDDKLAAYRVSRDQIIDQLISSWGGEPPRKPG